MNMCLGQYDYSRTMWLSGFMYFNDLLYVQPSLEETLNLGFYTCQEVEISYAAINKNGVSAYSPLLPYCAEGGE